MNATPLDENILVQTPPPSNHKKYGMIIGVVALVALVLGVVGYTLRSQVTTTQTTSTQARIVCPPALEPLKTVVVQCKSGVEMCAEPNGTFDVCGDGCKRVSPCVLKCRNAQGLEQFINECEQPSPTPPQKTPDVSCPVPNVVTNVTISCPKCAI